MRKRAFFAIICFSFVNICAIAENIKEYSHELNSQRISAILKNSGTPKAPEDFTDSFGADSLKITFNLENNKLEVTAKRERKVDTGFLAKSVVYELKLIDYLKSDHLGMVDQVDFNFKDTTEIIKDEKRKVVISKSRGEPFPVEMQEDLAIVYGLMLDYINDKWEIPYKIPGSYKSICIMKIFDLFCQKYFLPIPTILDRGKPVNPDAFREAVKNLDQTIQEMTNDQVRDIEKHRKRGLLGLFKFLD